MGPKLKEYGDYDVKVLWSIYKLDFTLFGWKRVTQHDYWQFLASSNQAFIGFPSPVFFALCPPTNSFHSSISLSYGSVKSFPRMAKLNEVVWQWQASNWPLSNSGLLFLPWSSRPLSNHQCSHNRSRIAWLVLFHGIDSLMVGFRASNSSGKSPKSILSISSDPIRWTGPPFKGFMAMASANISLCIMEGWEVHA